MLCEHIYAVLIGIDLGEGLIITATFEVQERVYQKQKYFKTCITLEQPIITLYLFLLLTGYEAF